MSTQPADPDRPTRKPPRTVVTFRLAESGKAAAQKYAAAQGYTGQHSTEGYTAWIRDLVQAEVTNPRHNLRPKPKGKP